MFEFLKTESFNIGFSFLIGLGLFALITPICIGKECRIEKAPSVEEIKETTYQIGSKCYKFEMESVACPKEGVIEPFSRRAGE
jgi:hypothetical protein